MKFKILYIIFIIVCVIYPFKLIYEPVTYRHILSLFILGVCIYEGFKSEKYLYLYFVFLFCLGFSSILTGYAGQFINKFFGTYIPIITAYTSTYILIKKYKGTNLLVWLFVGIAVFDALVTIGQFFHLGIVDRLYEGLRLDYNEEFHDKSGRRISLEGFAIPGLFDTVVNGYFLSATSLLVLFNKKSNIIINICLWLIVIIASLLAQERTGFFLAIIFSAFIIGKYIFAKSKSIGFVLVTVFFAVAAYFAVSYSDLLFSSDLRFAKGFETDSRDEMRAEAWNYLFSNPFGGAYDYDASGYRAPHNFFLNAFLYGGIIGGIFIIVLLVLQVIRIYPYLFRGKNTEYAQWAFIFGLMYIDYSLNSMLHNASIIHGTFMFFVWWGAFLGFAFLDEKEEKRNKVQLV